MATTAVALGKIEMQRRKEQPIPDGWALGEDGKVTNDAEEAFQMNKLLPLGGLEVTSGYKGMLRINKHFTHSKTVTWIDAFQPYNI